jgi:putative flippase GtrA
MILTLYALLAVLATAVNIGSQYVMIWLYAGAYAIPISIFVGTLVGLVLKYFLDKKYIFKFRANNMSHDGKVFVLYTAMGVATTFVFWGVEYAFHWYFASELMRYVGGVIGLAIGYVIKYFLDKRYVFVS